MKTKKKFEEPKLNVIKFEATEVKIRNLKLLPPPELTEFGIFG